MVFVYLPHIIINNKIKTIMNLENAMDKLTLMAVEYGPKLLGAILVLIIGIWVIKVLTGGFGKMLDKRKVNNSLTPFLKSLVSAILKILLIVSVLGMIGIQMTSFIAILGAAGLAVGMALWALCRILQEE